MAQTKTSTQIRNMYCDLSCLNIKFYNVNLSLQFTPFMQKSPNGMNTYDKSRLLVTTIDYESAYALYQAIKGIIEKKYPNGVTLSIPCNDGMLVLERKMDNGEFATFLVLSKNNTTIPFKFNTKTVKVNGGNDEVIEAGLGVFLKTVEGYLTGINADRHLDKLTEDFAKLMNGDSSENNNQKFNTNTSYQKNNNYNNKKNWNKNNNWNNKNNYQNRNNNSWEQNQPNQKNFSSYQLQE